ncbi:MAG: DUF2914 domain-containing protein [Acidobacteria bacterium]|nr:MAG: DUF2914 domain-containing protein [Acidobacteriota bacterium]
MGTAMENFGDQLRQERERRNVALDEIARSTKIRVRYLQALEDGQHERLPGIVFAKGYVRAYAETIGADADRLVTAYVAEQRSLGRLETEASQEHVLEALAAAVESDQDRAWRRVKMALIGSAVLLAAFAVFWFGVRPFFGREPAAATNAPISPAPVTGQESVPELIDAGTSQPVETQNDPVQSVETAAVQPKPDPAPPAVDVVQPEPAPAPIALATLSIPDYGVGTGVRRRTLVGEASEFETGTLVVFWNRVFGGEPGRHIRHVWFHEGNVTGLIELSIGASHWRTYSNQTLRRAGNWAVEAQDEDGRVLARKTFVATPRRR